MSVEQAYNYRAINESVATSGRVEPGQLAQLGDAGVEVVINLMPDAIEYAVEGDRS